MAWAAIRGGIPNRGDSATPLSRTDLESLKMTNDELSGTRSKARMAGACWLMTMAAH